MRHHPNKLEMARQIDRNDSQSCRFAARSPIFQLHDEPNWTWLISDIADARFNCIFDITVPASQAKTFLDQAVAPFAAKNVPVSLWLGPGTDLLSFTQALIEFGFRPAEPEPAMAVNLNDVADLDIDQRFRIQPVNDLNSLAQWFDVADKAFDYTPDLHKAWHQLHADIWPESDRPFHYYICLLADQPVAVSLLFTGEEIAGIFNVGTAPEHRRQGAGGAVVKAALRDAKIRNYQYAALHASEMGLSLYEKLGFQEYGKSCNFSWAPNAAESAQKNNTADQSGAVL